MQVGTSSWEWMPPDVAEKVLEQLKLKWGASAVFQRVCKRWQDAHDQSVRHLRLNTRRFNSALMMRRFLLRFQGLNEIDVRDNEPHYRPAVAVEGIGADGWLGIGGLAGLTALTRLSLKPCQQVSADGLQALAGLTTLTYRC
jgi:hypothetical protein